MKRKIHEAAFIEAYDLYADALFRYCYFRVKDRDLAKELVQETFAKTWAYLASGKEVENLRAFLYRVAHNTSVNEQTRTKALSLDELRDAGGYDPVDEREVTPEQGAEHALLLRHLAELDESAREVLTLRYLNGLPVQEIADMLGEELNAVSVRIHRSLAKLKERMQ